MKLLVGLIKAGGVTFFLGPWVSSGPNPKHGKDLGLLEYTSSHYWLCKLNPCQLLLGIQSFLPPLFLNFSSCISYRKYRKTFLTGNIFIIEIQDFFRTALQSPPTFERAMPLALQGYTENAIWMQMSEQLNRNSSHSSTTKHLRTLLNDF